MFTSNIYNDYVNNRYVLSFSETVLLSDGQEKSSKILISQQELKNRFLSFFVHR